MRERPSSGLLWALILAGPTAWTVQLYGDWLLSEVVTCAPATSGATVLGLSVRGVTALLTLATLAVSVAAGMLSLVWVRRLGPLADDVADPAGARAAWMAWSGLFGNVLFAIVIAAGLGPILVFEGCGSFLS